MDEDPDGDGKKVTFHLRFPGQYYDAESGLHYNGQRYYDPRTGRYLTPDPLGLAGGLNPYAYALNDPIAFRDAEGLIAETPWDLTNIGLGAVSLAANVGKRNYLGALIDGGGLLYDVFAATVPGLPGGASSAIKACRAGADDVTKGVKIAPGKFDYLFGRVTSNAHNAARSNQLALEMKRLGVPDTAAGRQMLTEHLEAAAKAEGNIMRTFSNQYGNFEVRESLFMGPSGKVANPRRRHTPTKHSNSLSLRKLVWIFRILMISWKRLALSRLKKTPAWPIAAT